MKTNNVGLDHAYAIVRSWVGPNAASSSGVGSSDGTTTIIGTTQYAFAGLTTTDLGSGRTLVSTQWKVPVRCATTVAGTLASSFEAGDLVDGITLALDDQILIKNQAAPAENGIYVVNTTGAPTRAFDMNVDVLVPGAVVDVLAGTTNAASLWMCTNQTAPVLETDAITFALINGSSSIGSSSGATGNDGTPPQTVPMPAWVKPTGSGAITADAQGMISVVSDGTYNAFPGIAFLEGRLHAVYRSGTNHVTSHDGVIRYRTSDTLGRTWGTDSTIASAASTDMRDPSIIALSSGRILVAYDALTSSGTVFAIKVIYSDNRGQSWSSPYTVPYTTYTYEIGQTAQMVEMPDGTVIMAATGRTGSGAKYVSLLFKSTDGGLTFGSQTDIANDATKDFLEPCIRLLASGKLVCLMGDNSTATWRSVSTDGGATWSTPTNVLAATGRNDFVEFYPGALFMMCRNNATNQKARWAVSWDEGATWTALQNVDGANDVFMYAAGFVLAPGYIGFLVAIEIGSTDCRLFMCYYHDGYGMDILGNLTVASGGGGGVTGFATPAVVLGTAAAAGAATTVIRSDSTIVAFDATAPVTQALADTAATGSAAVAARRDHKHGMPALSSATPLVESSSGAVGTAVPSSREDHVHPAAAAASGAHTHVATEQHLSDGSTTTYTLDNYYERESVVAWNTTTLARLTVTEVLPDKATVSAAGSAGDKIVFDYAATLA